MTGDGRAGARPGADRSRGTGDRAGKRRWRSRTLARGAGAALAAVAAGAVLAACGGGIILQDDLAVQRTGNEPGARLNLIVNDSGTVMCNGHKAVPITDPQLILARYLSMALADDAKQGMTLKPGPRPVFHYVVRTPDGQVSFSDDSPHVPSLFSQVGLLVLQISQGDCKLAL